jgi:hypothetical protein
MSDPKSKRASDRPTAPPTATMTNPPVSHERPKSSADLLEDEDEIPELLRGVSAKPPVRVPSDRPAPNVTRITPAKQPHGIVEEVVVSRRDPRRED